MNLRVSAKQSTICSCLDRGVDGRIDVVVGGRFDVVKSGGVWSGFSTLLS